MNKTKYNLKVELVGRNSKPDKTTMKKVQGIAKNQPMREYTVEELATAIGQGKVFYLCEFDKLGDVRMGNATHAYFLGIDVDNEIAGVPLNMENQKLMEGFIEEVREAFGMTPIITYHTFSHNPKVCNKFRLIYKFQEPINTNTFKKVYKAILERFNGEYDVIDPAAKNINRAWIGTNKRVLVHEDYIPIASDWVKEIDKKYEEVKVQPLQEPNLPTRIFTDGSRNATFQKYLSGKINNRDLRDYNTLLAFAQNCNRTMCQPPMEDDELQGIVNSVYKNLADGTYNVFDNSLKPTTTVTTPPITDEEIDDLFEKTNGNKLLDSLFEKTEGLYKQGGIELVSTGFCELDKQIGGGLYNGLYVVGAGSSIGKTTFVQQISDFVANNGRNVLFFSLEMGKNEMLAKTLTREVYKNNRYFKIGAQEFLNGRFSEKDWETIQKYKPLVENTTKNVFYIEGTFQTTIQDIVKIAHAFKTRLNAPLMVVIDYLQVINPIDVRTTEKVNMDKNIAELKRLSRDLDVPVMAISSVNRQNYYNYIDFSSFKESGSIEYGADVVIGLQLTAIHKIAKMREGEGNLKRDLFNEAKKEIPRQIESVVLKNRYGRTGLSYWYRYMPKFNLFEELSTSEFEEKQKSIIGEKMNQKELNLFDK